MGRLEQAGHCQIDISGLLLTSDTSVNAQIILSIYQNTRKYGRSDKIWKDIHGARPTWLSLVNIDHFLSSLWQAAGRGQQLVPVREKALRSRP
jgi:hypothetical protein